MGEGGAKGMLPLSKMGGGGAPSLPTPMYLFLSVTRIRGRNQTGRVTSSESVFIIL